MIATNCRSAANNLVEAARRGLEPDRATRAHLRSCESCAERFAAERSLARRFSEMRAATAGLRSSESSRESLLREFAARSPKPVRRHWTSVLAMAAAVALCFTLLRTWGPSVRPVSPKNTVAGAIHSGFGSAADPRPVDLQEEGFIAVPFVPPLATGETVSVIHTELYPAALATLGINVDPAWTTEVSADLLMGEDGFPRAVRVSNDESYSRKF